jgi:RNA recognition motif-containing protein
VSFVQLFDDETGRPRGAGVLEFPSADLAKKAIEKMHRLEYKG